jgi:predicted RNA-binding Zn-ribbon protein involved in translation (DUF1610 family)
MGSMVAPYVCPRCGQKGSKKKWCRECRIVYCQSCNNSNNNTFDCPKCKNTMVVTESNGYITHSLIKG